MKKKSIMIIDDEKDILFLLQKILSKAGFIVFTESHGNKAIEVIKKTSPDLVILDINMPEIDGMKIKSQLNNIFELAYIPVIFLTGKDKISFKIKSFYLGAVDYICKPFNKNELIARINNILDRKDFYESISMTDTLTGLYNNNFYKKYIHLSFDIARRYNKIFSMAIIDIDNLKFINDTYGHLAGDFILKIFSSIAKKVFRDSDIIIRYGGDEFVIILSETDNEQAEKAIERLKNSIEGKEFLFKDTNIKIHFSVSAGLVTFDDIIINTSHMFKLADERLYKNKYRKKELMLFKNKVS